MSRPRLIALLLALATLAVYLPVVRHDFINCDDDVYVTDNPMVLQGLSWAGVKWAFTTTHAANWHPLTWLSHMADCEFFQLHAGAPHFENALFHAANSALLFLLLWRLTGLVPPSLLAAALFAWHPLHVESVAWVAERKDVLSTFLALLSLLSYVKYVNGKSRRGLWWALAFFALGLLAKPMLVTLPFILLLLDFWPLNRIPNAGFGLRNIKPLLVEKIPFFVLTAISCVVTFIAQRAGGAVITVQQLPLHYRLENAAVSVMLYLWEMLHPVGLAVLYPYAAPSIYAVKASIAMLVIITGAAWLVRNVNRCWLMGWLWFLGTLVPVIGLVQVGAAPMADRYTYIPSIGVFCAVAFGLYDLSWLKKLYPVVLVACSIPCVVMTEKQLSYWQDSESLFNHTLDVTHDNESACIDVAQAYYQKGDYTNAVGAYLEADRLDHHSNYHVLFALGDTFMRMGQPESAFDSYRDCLKLNPGLSSAHTALGRALMALGEYGHALPEFAAAEQLATNDAAPYLEQAKIHFLMGLDSQAAKELHAAVRAQPDDFLTLATVAHYLAANTNATDRDPQGALLLAVKANDLSGNRQPEVLDALGMAFAATGDFTNAIACASNALRYASPARMPDAGPIRQRLELYQNHQPWRESLRATNGPAM